MEPVKDFIGKPAPPGYVAGFGRGATGFTTRSDIGPAREASTAKRQGIGANNKPQTSTSKDDSDDEALNEANFDKFEGYRFSLFDKQEYTKEDEEADLIYASLDQEMQDRTKRAKEKKQLEMVKKQKSQQTIRQQFADCRRELSKMTYEDWISIPEVGDSRNRKQRVARQEKITPLPERLLAYQATRNATNVYVDDVPMDVEDQKPEDKTISSFEERRKKLQESLQTARNIKQPQQEPTNPQELLLQIEELEEQQPRNIKMIDEKSISEQIKTFIKMTKRHPEKSLAWVGLTQLLERSGKVKKAREIIHDACKVCPSSEVWLEMARLHPPSDAKFILLKGCKIRRTSAKLWLKAADFEDDIEEKKKIVLNGLDNVPDSIELRQMAIQLSQGLDLEKLLIDGIKINPNFTEFSIILSKLKPYEESKRIICDAIEKNPSLVNLRIAAARLEESKGDNKTISAMVEWMLDDLKELDWLELQKEVIECEKEGFQLTSFEIIRHAWKGKLTDDPNPLLHEANALIEAEAYQSARFIYKLILEDQKFKSMVVVWQSYAEFERMHGNKVTLVNVLREAVQFCKESVGLWLALSDELIDNPDESKQVLSQALEANKESEKIVIALVKIELKCKNYNEGRRKLNEARKIADTAQLCLESAHLELSLNNIDEAIESLKLGCEKFKKSSEIFLTYGRALEEKQLYDEAKKQYSIGIKNNPNSAQLYIAIAKLEEKMGSIPRSRSKLQTGLCLMPKNIDLILESARCEVRANNVQGAIRILSKGLRECKPNPDCYKLELLYSELETKNKRFKLNPF